MRKLFKASFFTFLKSKVGMILLSAIIFLTSATFTLLQSTAHSFNRSYEEVTTTGALHDFTVKEKYAIQGDVQIDAQASAPKNQTVFKNVKNVLDDGYIYLRPKKLSGAEAEMLSIKGGAATYDTYFRISRSQIVLKDSDNDGAPDSIDLTNGIDIQFFSPTSSVTTGGLGFMAGSAINTLEGHPDGMSKLSTGQVWANGGHINSTTPATYDIKIGSATFHIGVKADFAKLLVDYVKAKGALVTEESVDVTFPKPTTVSGNYLSHLASIDWDQFVNSTLGKTKIVVPKTDLDATGTPTNVNLVAPIASALGLLKQDLQSKVSKSLSDDFIKDVNDIYGPSSQNHKLDMTSVKSTNINVGEKKFKVVNGSREDGVDKLVIFSGSKPQAPKSDAEMQIGLDAALKASKDYNNEPLTKITNKEYRFDYTWNKAAGLGMEAPHSVHYIDPSSFEAVVTPEFARLNNITPLEDPSVVEKILAAAVEEAKNDRSITEAVYVSNIIKEKYSNNVIWIDSTPYFITGTGTTPDFSYPIVDPSSPIPNQKDQAILFTNSRGYGRIYDAYRGNQHEDYLAYKFVDGVSQDEKASIMEKVEEIAVQKMAWGKNVDHITSAYNDTSETVILAPQRVAFLEKLKGTIATISYLTTALLALFSALVVTLVIKKTINANKKNYAILRANGYSRKEIALSNTSIAVIIGLISTALGYVAGHFLQYAFIRMFDNYWTLPVTAHAFSWVSLVVTVAIPFAGLAILAFVLTLWEMRGSIPAILAGGGSKTARGAVGKLISPMKFVGIKTKTSLSLFLTNISKMVLIFVSAGAAVVALSTSISTMHKFDYAKTQSLNAKSYEYDLELASPTTEGGLMTKLPIEQLYEDYKDTNGVHKGVTNSTKPFVDPSTPVLSTPEFHTPQMSDGDPKWKNNAHYLENKIQFKALLDINLSGNNPWNTAAAVMPENQQNLSNIQNEKFLAFAANFDGTYLTGANHKKNTDAWSSYLDKSPNGVYTIKQTVFPGPADLTNLKPGYKEFIYNGMRAAIDAYLKSPDRNPEFLPFFISYKNIIMDADDETYTFIDGKFKMKAINGKTEAERVKIKGIDADTKNIKLSKEAISALEKFNATPDVVPVVANEYFLTKYGRKVGDEFPIEVQNMNDRFHEGILGLKTKTVTVHIVGKQETYNDNQLFTLHKYANQALGWTGADADNAFNGIYTKHKNSVLFKSIGLYSQSGMYPGTDTLSSDVVNNPIAKNVAEYITSHQSIYPGIAKYEDFISNQVYSASPYVMVYSNVNWSYTDEYRFDNVMKISSELIYIIEGIVIVLAALFVIIISIMMINDNKKFIATLKVMGYRENEISRMVFAAFLPSLILAFFVAAPIAFSIVLMLKVAIMGFGAILVPLTLTWWTIAIAFGIIVLGIVVVYWLSSRQLKNTSMLQAFQE